MWKTGDEGQELRRTFIYDTNGMRTKRIEPDGTVYEYIYNSGLLVQMTIDNSTTTSVEHTMYFTYDANGTPVSVTLNGTTYYYATNLQGDVVAIFNRHGHIVASYVYNAWGCLLGETHMSWVCNPVQQDCAGEEDDSLNSIGRLNPLRYRGYVYDKETKLYYLQSRYYNPEIGRFLTADNPDYLGADGTPTSYNLFAYCSNNPVMYSDPTGHFINTITGTIVGALIGAINAAIKGDDVWAGMVIGAATGAIAGLTADIAIATGGIGAIALAALGGAGSSGLNYAATELANGRDVKIGALVMEMTVGAAANLLTFGVGGGSLTSRGGKILSNMTKDFTETIMKGTTKTVAGKTVSRAAPIVRKIMINNFLASTAETAVISVGAWLNSNAWGVLI